MSRHLLLALLLGALLPAPRAVAGSAVQGRWTFVEGDVEPALLEEAARLGDALLAEVAARHGERPEDAAPPLRLRLLPDRAALLAALPEEARRGGLEGAGGWTAPGGRTSWVARQSDPFETRRLVLHELSHQATARLFPASERGPAWWREGRAELDGWHRRTAGGLVLGALDAVSRSGMPDRARDVARRPGADVWALLVQTSPATWADGLALVTALLRTPDQEVRAAFLAWEADVLRHGDDGALARRHLEPLRERVVAAVHGWWAAWRRPWRVAGGRWDEGPAGIVGVADGDAARLEQAADLPVAGRGRRLGATVATGAEGAAGLELVLGGAGADARRVSWLLDGAAVVLREGGPDGVAVLGRIGLAEGDARAALRLELELDVAQRVVHARVGRGTPDPPRSISAAVGMPGADVPVGAALLVVAGEATFSDVAPAPEEPTGASR